MAEQIYDIVILVLTFVAGVAIGRLIGFKQVLKLYDKKG